MLWKRELSKLMQPLNDKNGISGADRTIFIDWLIGLSLQSQMDCDVIFTAIDIFDDYTRISKTATNKSLIITTMACLLLSQEFHESGYLDLDVICPAVGKDITSQEVCL
jgi:hypothetical protein